MEDENKKIKLSRLQSVALLLASFFVGTKSSDAGIAVIDLLTWFYN
jgi:hypothetical protein